jgi:hypothetical protein
MCAISSTPPISAGLLFLVSEIICKNESLKKIISQPEVIEESNKGTTDYHKIGNYDASKREPEFALPYGDNSVNLWEFCLLRHHFHPSVQAFTKSMLTEPEHKITFDGDPTIEFSLMVFALYIIYLFYRIFPWN